MTSCRMLPPHRPHNEMEEFQQRVVEEKAQLDDKLSRLRPFVLSNRFATLPSGEQYRMNRQLDLMEQYSAVLAQRIAAFQ